MAPGLLLCSPTSAMARVSFSPLKCEIPSFFLLQHFTGVAKKIRPTRLFCSCVCAEEPATDMAGYREAFSKKMAMAGLRPHHRIAVGVSGGPDSMALCVLAANWKTEGPKGIDKSGGSIDGLLAIIVDHGLRAESKDEADLVRCRVSQMGIRCEIARCQWPEGRPKQGHLQEAARELRYQRLLEACLQNSTGVLLVAHHADDQAELFILRSSRGSGVLGLAGMALTSQVFPSHISSYERRLDYHGILLVRPLLDFSKNDLYKVCQESDKDWVEDPTNQSSLFARNRIRMSLAGFSSDIFKSELQAVIAACRKTRTYLDQICCNLMRQNVTIVNPQGYAVIDLERLNTSRLEDICLSRFSALVLQFISQRQRPVRGGASKLLLEYMRTVPCRTSLTAAGCYLCPAPGSKGTKALVCCSVNCSLPVKTELIYEQNGEDQKWQVPNELKEIITDGKSYSSSSMPDSSEVHFVGKLSVSVIDEARRLGILNESTYRNIILLQREETERFKSKTNTASDSEYEVESLSAHPSELRPGETCYFMNRFLISWKRNDEFSGGEVSQGAYCCSNSSDETLCTRWPCIFEHDMVAEVRPMLEADWLYLSELSRSPSSEDTGSENVMSSSGGRQEVDNAKLCSSYSRRSARKALLSLKSIPAAARRSLPVLVSRHGLLLSIPNIGYQHCPCLMVSAEFRPRVSLGGGYHVFI